MNNILSRLRETAEFLKKQFEHTVRIGVVLGSGLGNFVNEIEVEKEIDYHDIPNFPVSTVEGHKGKLFFGKVAGKRIVAMAGRFHFYEGYAAADVVFPIRVMKLIGVEIVLLSNAAGGVNPDFKIGDLMIIRDHIGLSTVNPLIGKNMDELGTRFPDMSEPYKNYLIVKAKEVATRLNIDVKEGVYYAVTGPTYETKSEYRMVHILGGDAVGMSTVQETIAANHMGMHVFAMSVITDIGLQDSFISHEEVLVAAKAAEPKFAAIFKGLIEIV